MNNKNVYSYVNNNKMELMSLIRKRRMYSNFDLSFLFITFDLINLDKQFY